MCFDYRESKKRKDGNYVLYLDGNELEGTYITGAGGSLHVVDPESSKKVIQVSIKDLAGHYSGQHHLFSRVLMSPFEVFKTKVILTLSLNENFAYRKHFSYEIRFALKADIERWDNPFTFLAYKLKFEELANARGLLTSRTKYLGERTDELRIDYHMADRIEITRNFDCESETVEEMFGGYLDEIRFLNKAVFNELSPKNAHSKTKGRSSKRKYDVFISHASEDKEEIVRPLALLLKQAGLKVWFDEFELKVGDKLRRSIDKGLATSKHGIVVLSHSFFNKNWTQYELDSLIQREMADKGLLLLPIWHKLTEDEVRNYSLALADIVALKTTESTLEEMADKLAQSLK